jgi:hypothetical protein
MNLKSLLLVGLLSLASPALAHEAKGPNGGRLTDAGAYHVELVAKQGGIEVFVSDDKEKPVSATGFKGLAILVIGGKSERIVLEPSGTDRLRGTASTTVPNTAKGVIQLTGPDGKVSQAKFN